MLFECLTKALFLLTVDDIAGSCPFSFLFRFTLVVSVSLSSSKSAAGAVERPVAVFWISQMNLGRLLHEQ